MSELKAFRIIQGDTGGCGAPSYKCDTDGNRIEEWSDICEVYDKFEADKVIADLEESHKMEVEQLLMEIEELKEGAENLILDNYLKDREIKHHKYKRCLAMAWWCSAELGMLVSTWESKIKHYKKWQKRWLELAEKFKEGV